MDIKALAQDAAPYVVERRHYYHQHPELTGEEKNTRDAIHRDLEALGITDIRDMVNCYGLVATIHGGKPGKTVGLRADTDALPFQEETGLPFASCEPGKMHACGHDTHIAMLLGAAKLLQEHREELCGDVRLIFQPAEEHVIGSKAMIAEGALDGVDAIFGQHVWGTLDIPYIDVTAGPRMAYSGRCLLSGYINKRDPNQGTCTNACRWEYNVAEGKEDDVGNIVHKYEPIPVQTVEPTLGIGAPTDKVFMIEEAKRPGEYMTAFEDEHGTYIMNSKDLRAIAHVERLTQMGVHSLKIEGRTKSFYYCARTAQVYRKAIDDAAAGKPFDTSLLETLEGLAHRGYTEGFLRRHTHDDYQNYEYGYSVSERQQFVGEFTGERNGPLAAVAVKNKFSVGDSLELMTPQGNVNFTLEHMENGKGETMPVAPGDGYTVWLPVPDDLPLQYALLMRNFTGQTTRNPHGN